MPGDSDKFFCLLPPQQDWQFPKFRVVYSVEEQPRQLSKVMLRHLSVSILDADRMPNPHAIEMIMKELGFKRPIKECQVWIEKEYKAVNVLDFFDEVPIIKS